MAEIKYHKDIETPTCPFCHQAMQLMNADFDKENNLIRAQHICGCRAGKGVGPYFDTWYAVKRAS